MANTQESGYFNAHKIIVGVDYGTTFTGVAYVTTAKNDIDDIVVITSWPGTGRHSETVFKVPSRIAYPDENYKIQDIKWGFQVEPRMTSYSWTKLLLDKNGPAAEFDDETLALQAAVGMPVLRLPKNKDAVSVAGDFLKAIYKHTINILEKQISEKTLAVTPLEFWFTMPAIWSDEAQSATREAAMQAGFASRRGDQIFMITEPEAAALAALKRSASAGPLMCPKEGDGILICDCGGGTVDITTYRIIGVYPRLTFEELCTGTGAKCGSTTIDREFYKLMSKRFGDAFDRLPLKLKGPGSEFMNAFERIKQDFGYSTVGDEIYELPLDMSTEDALPKYFDEDERLVKISQQDVCNLFDPVVERVKALVLQQIGAANLDAAEDVINKIILVGGFGDSEYLRKALKQHFTATSDIQLIVPQYPQAAIVKGAVLRGLEGVRPTTRRCRRHYGFCYVAPFRKGVDDEAKATFCEFYGTKFGPPRMNWMIEKGEKVLENTCQRVELYRSSTVPFTKISTCLYSCSLDDAPQDPSHQRVNIVGNIVSDVSNISSPFIESKINQNGVRVYALHFEIEMHFGAKEGVLKFKTVVGGNVVGEAEIDFSKN